MMKKNLSIFLLLILFVQFCLYMPKVYAQDSTSILVKADKTKYNIGEKIKVTIESGNVASLYGVGFTLKYDTSSLKLTKDLEVTGGYTIQGKDMRYADNGIISYAIISKNDVDKSNVIGELNFTALKAYTSNLDLTDIKAVKAVDESVKEISVNKQYSVSVQIVSAQNNNDNNKNNGNGTIPSTEIPKVIFDRYEGADRYETCVKISQAGWKTSDYAILTTGEDFPDALSAAPLAKKYNAPILITNPMTLTSIVEKEIDRLNLKTIYIVGGTNAVSQAIEERIVSKGIKCIRLKGNNRYETALAIADYLGPSSEIVIATGEDFPDALSIASYAAFKNIPILLTNSEILPDNIINYIKNSKVTKSYVIGGTKVVSDAVFNMLPGAERLYGNNRYDTNISVLKKLSTVFDFSTVYFATGEDFPDALTGSALAASAQAPIILVNSNLSQGQDTVQLIKDNLSKIKAGHALGGKKVVPDSLSDLFKK